MPPLIRSQFIGVTTAASVERDGLLQGSWHAESEALTSGNALCVIVATYQVRCDAWPSGPSTGFSCDRRSAVVRTSSITTRTRLL